MLRGKTIISNELKQAWLEAWGTFFKTNIKACRTLTGESNVLGKSIFNLYILSSKKSKKPTLPYPTKRVDALTKPHMKASFIGYWVSTNTFVSLSDILYSTPNLQFKQLCCDHQFDILEPGVVLGSNGWYYARIKWFATPDVDHIPREFIASFTADGDINVNGIYVYSSFSIEGEPDVVAPNHLHSSIPSSKIDAFMQRVQNGDPIPMDYEYMLFRLGKTPYWIWDLVDATHLPDGTLI